MNPIIELEGVGMRYVRREHKRGWAAIRGALRREHNDLWALRDVDLAIEPGEVVGVTGANGAGKSTLLRLIAGALRPTEGRVTVRGRVAPLLAIGAGFAPALSGVENIYLGGALIGLDKQEMKPLVDPILAWAELEDYAQMPLAHYSAGMQARLGFSVASHLDVDIILVDEILAVGDAAFQAKCAERVDEWVQGDHTVVIAQHQPELLQELGARVVRL